MVTKFKYGPYDHIEEGPTAYTRSLFIGCCFRLSGIGFWEPSVMQSESLERNGFVMRFSA